MHQTTQFWTGALLALSALLILSCDTVASVLGPGASSASSKNLRVSYRSGPCYGRCEVFTLELYANGLMLFKGERFTERPGVWEKNIDRRRMVGLLDSFERADFENYPVSFRSQIPDAATTEIIWYDEDQTAYRTSFKEFASPELEQLSLQIRRLAGTEGWKQISETITETGAVPVANKAREEIIVQLASGVQVKAWIIAYGKQNVQFVKRISPNGDYYLITADPNIMSAEELLEFLRQDKDVLGAQLNGKVEGRD